MCVRVCASARAEWLANTHTHTHTHTYICVCVCVCVCICQPLRTSRMRHKVVNLLWGLTRLNSEFSFSYTGFYTKVEYPGLPSYLSIAGWRIIGFIPFTWVSAFCERHNLGFELGLPCKFLTTETNKPRTPPLYIYIYIYKVKLATLVEGDPKAPFSIA